MLVVGAADQVEDDAKVLYFPPRRCCLSALRFLSGFLRGARSMPTPERCLPCAPGGGDCRMFTGWKRIQRATGAIPGVVLVAILFAEYAINSDEEAAHLPIAEVPPPLTYPNF